MDLLPYVKPALRITVDAFDIEIQDLIDAAMADLILAGVAADKAVGTDPLIKRAVTTYCKANFGFDNPDADRLQMSFDLLKRHLTLAQDYICHAVTFMVTTGGVPVKGASITLNDETKASNSLGVAVFSVIELEVDFDYMITKDGYMDYSGSVYVDGNESVLVVMADVV